MPPKSKPKARAFKATTSSKPSSSTSLDPPLPFLRAPAHLEPFTSKLDQDHVYITHIDSKPRDFKRKIFAVPLLMNVALIALLLWRIANIGPYYTKIFFSVLGQTNETTIDTSQISSKEMAAEILRRTVKFMTDFVLKVFVYPWPRDFFAGQVIGNPMAWRLAIGFREKEIIVRRSRKWDVDIGDPLDSDSPGQQLLFNNLRVAVEPSYMSEKTGYLMLNKQWDLDWKTILAATKLVDQKNLLLEAFRTTILIHSKTFGWLVVETGAAGGSVKEEEGRRKIVAFKDELMAMGKENLFFKWIELVQYESSQPGGFGPEQQARTMAKAKAMFEAQGVDFEKFWAKVGGMQGMPGMDGT